MPCFRPRQAFQSVVPNENGKYPLAFVRNYPYVEECVVPCSHCCGCKLERARQWGVRSYHETSSCEASSFITLTYSNQFLPEDGSLKKEDFQKFMKRLRFHTGVKVRYMMCGEYGAKLGRPHFHACIFGYDFPDKKLWSNSHKFPLYVSSELERLWPFGFSTIGEVTFESAAYVARYTVKKFNAHDIDVMARFAKETGTAVCTTAMVSELIEVYERYFEAHPNRPRGGTSSDSVLRWYYKDKHYGGKLPEYISASLKPGLGADWFEKYHSDVYPNDLVVYNGRAAKPPRYYDKLYERSDPSAFAELKQKRKEKALALSDHRDNTPERLLVREQVKIEQISRLFRNLDMQLHSGG